MADSLTCRNCYMIHAKNPFADSSASNQLRLRAGVSTVCFLLTRFDSGKKMRSVLATVAVHPVNEILDFAEENPCKIQQL